MINHYKKWKIIRKYFIFVVELWMKLNRIKLENLFKERFYKFDQIFHSIHAEIQKNGVDCELIMIFSIINYVFTNSFNSDKQLIDEKIRESEELIMNRISK